MTVILQLYELDLFSPQRGIMVFSMSLSLVATCLYTYAPAPPNLLLFRDLNESSRIESNPLISLLS